MTIPLQRDLRVAMSASVREVLGRRWEVQQQDVATVNRALQTRNQRDPEVFGIVSQPGVGQLPVVEGQGERVESENVRPLDQSLRIVGNKVFRILRGMQVKVDFQGHFHSFVQLPY